MKRLICTLLVMMMLGSLCVGALAEEPAPDGDELAIASAEPVAPPEEEAALGAEDFPLALDGADPTTYPVWVGSTQVTSDNKDDILGDGAASYTPGEGSGTLTFTTATPNITGTHASGALIYADGIDLTISAPSGLTLNNTYYCVYVDSITINGNVNLTSSNNIALYSRAGNVSIGGDATITSEGFCIDAEGSVSIDGNADLTSSSGMAVCSRGENGTKITGNLTARANHMHVIDAYKGDVQIGGNADLENTYSDGFGIFAGEGNVSIGGDATITSKSACINADGGISIGGSADLTSSNGFALCSMGVAGITITGNLTASANHVHGILAYKGDIQIGGNANVNNTNSSGHGITASEGKVIMTSGKWDITSGAYDALFAKSGIEIPTTHEITTPTGGKIAQVGGVYTVTESDGTTVAAHAIIEPKAVTTFPVRVNVTTQDQDGNAISAVGGTATASPATVSKGDTITVTATPNEGYALEEIVFGDGISVTGFHHGTDTSATVPDDFTPVASDNAVVIDVTFKALPTFTVSFDANGGTGSMVDVTVNKDASYTLPACTFTAPDGKEFDAWDAGAVGASVTISADTTIKAVWKDKATTPDPVTYSFSAGASGTWTKGGTTTLDFTVKRSAEDDTTISHFTGIEIDGAAVGSTEYTAVSGSVNLGLKASYLETLSVGEHTLNVKFDDGAVSTKFTVKAAQSGGTTQQDGGATQQTNAGSGGGTKKTASAGGTSPKTGDENDVALWALVLGASMLGLGAVLTLRKKQAHR